MTRSLILPMMVAALAASCASLAGLPDVPSPEDAGAVDASTEGAATREGGQESSASGSDSAPDGGIEAGDAAADGCSVTGTGAVEALGCPCASAGELACSGNTQRQTLICNGGAWAPDGQCPLAQLCDSEPGPDQGTCQPVDPPCASASPGQVVCGSATTVVRCGADLVSDSPVETCAQPTPDCNGGSCGCAETMCPGACADEQTDPEHCGGCATACPAGGMCHGGSCACPEGDAVCNDACVDEQTDTSNCGGCGLACSVACTAGQCLVTLASVPSGQVNGMAVTGTNVYLAGPQALMSVPIGGGALTTVLPVAANLVAVDEARVYWTSQTLGEVTSLPLAGGMPTMLASGQNQPIAIAVDGTSVYWANAASIVGNDGTVMSAPLGGGAPTTLASGQTGPLAIAADSTSVYWTEAGALMRVPLAGGTPTMLAAAENSLSNLAVGATSVYWTDYRGGTVMSVPLAGGPPVTVASGQSGPGAIAVDGTSVYWVTRGTLADSFLNGSVMSVPLGGGTPTTLVSGQNTPAALAVDGTSVYWTTSPNALPSLVMKFTPK